MKFDGMENVERFWKKYKNRFFFYMPEDFSIEATKSTS